MNPIATKSGAGGISLPDGCPGITPKEQLANSGTSLRPAPADAVKSSSRKNSSISLWLWVAGGYIFMSILWTVMFKVVGSAKVQSVPLATQGAKP